MTQADVGMANVGSMWDAASHESSSLDEESSWTSCQETWNQRMMTVLEARQITRASRATMEVIRASREEAMVSREAILASREANIVAREATLASREATVAAKTTPQSMEESEDGNWSCETDSDESNWGPHLGLNSLAGIMEREPVFSKEAVKRTHHSAETTTQPNATKKQ